MGHLDGRTAIITGSSRGIGKAIAKRLAADGARVVLNGRDAEASARAAAEIASAGAPAPLVFAGDVTEPAFVAALVDSTVAQLGAVDIVVNNAWSGMHVNRLENKDEQQFSAAFDVAFYPALRLMQAAFPGMRSRGWGRIVNVGSLNGVNAHVYSAEYNVAKEALRALTRTAAREWFKYGITANVICPAARVERHDIAWGDDADAVAARIGQALPAGRMGDPGLDIAGVVAFLCGEDARFLTGNTVFADGGAHISGVAWEPEPEEDAPGIAVESAIHRGAAGLTAGSGN